MFDGRLTRRLCATFFFMLFGSSMLLGSSAAFAQDLGLPRLAVPLDVREYPHYDTYDAAIAIGVGKLRAFDVGFDTGSTGLRLFAVPGIGSPGSGTRCSHMPTSVTYGNPGRITYSGVVCYAYLRIGPLATMQAVPFALLTSASCPPTNPHCTITTPQQNYAHGNYGVFGAGYALGDVLPNPLRILPGSFGERFAVHVTTTGGELLLGGGPFPGEVFPLVPQGLGALGRMGYRSGPECIVVNGEAPRACTEVVYDTGNGVPFFYADIPNLPVENGYVRPGTSIGFAPPCGGAVATTIVAGTTFATMYKAQLSSNNPLVNVGIAGFLGQEVGFDSMRPNVCGPIRTYGVMTIAPDTE